MFGRQHLLGAALVLYAIALPAATSAPAQAAPSTKPVIIAYTDFPDSFNALAVSTSTRSAFSVALITNEPLIGMDPQTQKPFPAVAKSWKFSKDGKTITVLLRPHLRFSDGRTLTADDVVYSLQIQQSQQLLLPQIQSFTKVNSLTVRFKLSNYTPAFTTSWASDYSAIFEKRAMEAYHIAPADWAKPNWGTDYKIIPVEAGPYKISSFVKGDHVTLTANPYYWRGRPKINPIIIKTVASSPAILTQLRSGDVQGTPVAPSDLSSIDRSRDALYVAPGSRVYQLYPNLKRPYFADRRVRQAVLYAIDRKGIALTVFQKQADITNVDVTYGNRFYAPHLTSYAYSPSKAKSLLNAAGWKPGSGGIRSKGGVRFSFTLKFANNDPLYSNIALVVQANLAAVGIEVTLGPTDPSILSHLFTPTDPYRNSVDATVSRYGSTAYPFYRAYYLCNAPFNWVSYCNPSLDKDIVATESAVSGTAQKRAQDAVQAILNRDLPHIYLVTPRDLFVVDKRIKGFSPGFSAGLQSAWKWHWSK